jgi:hypothetical protein
MESEMRRLRFSKGDESMDALMFSASGGDDSLESNRLHNATLSALSWSGVSVDCISGASACGVMPDGSWYTNNENIGVQP